MQNRKVIVYIAASLDGYIAKPNDDLSFLSIVEKQGEDYGYHQFTENIDTIIQGRKTYEWVMKQVPEYPHFHKQTYIITRTKRESIGNVHFYTDDIKALIANIKSQAGKDIFVDGGAEIVHLLLQNKLIDEIILSIIPVLLGEGLRLFQDNIGEQTLQLVDSKHFDTGLVQVHYRLIKTD